MKTLQRMSVSASAAAVGLYYSAGTAFAQIFGSVPNIGGETDARSAAINIVKAVLQFMALVAVVIIVIAGIRLVVSQGDETAVDKAKKTILFTVVGLIVILLAQAIVDFVANNLTSAGS